MATIDTLNVRITADLSDLKRELDRSTRAVEDSSRRMAESTKKAEAGFTALSRVLTAATVLVVANFTKNQILAAAALKDSAEAAGLSTTAFQVFSRAAIDGGATAEQFSASMGRFQQAIAETAKGNGELIKTFRNLGVGVLDSSGKLRGNEDILLDVADAIARIPDPAQRTAAAMELFGRSGAKLVNMLAQGKIALQEFGKKLKETGSIVEEDTITNFDLLTKAIERLYDVGVTKLQNFLGDAYAGFKRLNDELTKGPGFAEELLEINRQLEALEGNKSAYANVMRPRLQARRDALLATGPDPKGFGGASGGPGGGTLPMSETSRKLLDNIEMQMRLAQVTGDTADAIERERLIIEARDKAIQAGMVGAQIENYVRLATTVYDLTAAEKARFDGIEAGLDHLRESMEAEQKLIEFKDKLLTRTQDEVADNARLLEALKRGTKEYEQEAKLLQIINEAKAAKVDLTDEEIENYKRLAEQIGAQNDEMDKLKDRYEENQRASRDFANVISKALEDAMVKGEGLRGIMQGLLEDIQRIIIRTTVTKPFEKFLTGAIEGIGSAGGGSNVAPGEHGWLGDILKGFPGFAGGGDPPVGRPSIVGEKGPELFVPKTSGTVIPGGKMGAGTTNNFQVDMRGASVEAVMELRRLVMEVNGSIEQRAVSAVVGARHRNPNMF